MAVYLNSWLDDMCVYEFKIMVMHEWITKKRLEKAKKNNN